MDDRSALPPWPLAGGEPLAAPRQPAALSAGVGSPLEREGIAFALKVTARVLAVGLVWAACSALAAPRLIEAAYRGDLPAVLPPLLDAAAHPLEKYLQDGAAIARRVLALLLVAGLLPLPLSAAGWCRDEIRDARGRISAAMWNAALAVLCAASVVAFLLFAPAVYVTFIAEDSWAEQASFVAWAMAACFLGFAWIREPRLRRPAIALLGLGAAFVALEEISWGQRILDLPTPELLAERNLQGELNLHNLLPVESLQYLAAGAGVLLWGFALPWVTRRARSLGRLCERLGVPLVPAHLRPWFAAAGAALLARDWLLSGEVGELLLAFAIAALALELAPTLRPDRLPRTAFGGRAIAGLVLSVAALTALLVQVCATPELLRMKLHQFAASRLPEAGLERQAAALFEYLEQRPPLRLPETRLEHGRLLLAAGRPEAAHAVLARALDDQRERESESPDRPEVLRLSGELLTLLGRGAEAEATLRRAEGLDRERLARSGDPVRAARIRFSLARTLAALGQREQAALELAQAGAAAPDPRTAFALRRWTAAGGLPLRSL